MKPRGAEQGVGIVDVQLGMVVAQATTVMKSPVALVLLALLIPACDRVDSGAFDANDFGLDGEPDATVVDEPADANPDANPDASPEISCGPTDVRLVTNERSNAGSVMITTVDDGLRVELETNGRWRLTAVEAFAGIGAPPNDGSALSPERFPVIADMDPTEAFGFTIPFEQIEGGSCGDALVVAIYATVGKERDGELESLQTAWAEGPEGIDPGWGSEVEVTLCCE